MSKIVQDEARARASEGSSSDKIYDAILSELSGLPDLSEFNVIDIGCGKGELLGRLADLHNVQNLSGMDLVDYTDSKPFNFIQKNLDDDFSSGYEESFDLVLASEVIEHLENPRSFIRKLLKITKVGGRVVISTPNIESFLSQLTFFTKGYHSAFGPKNYPAHITPISKFEMGNMVKESGQGLLLKVFYADNGRVPGTSLQWQHFLPFLRGKWFSDNVIFVLEKLKV